MNVRLTVFDHPLASPPEPGRSTLVDWDRVVDRCKAPGAWPGDVDDDALKSAVPGWSFSRWDCDDKRKRTEDERMGQPRHWPALEVAGLALDYDDEPMVGRDQIRAWWGVWTYAAHTSASHLRPKGDQPALPRWRVLLPFSSPCTPEDYVLVGQWARHPRRGAGVLGQECEHPRRWYYRPARRGDTYESDANVGQPLDPKACIAELERWRAEEPAPEPIPLVTPTLRAVSGDSVEYRRRAHARGALLGAAARLRAMPQGQRHPAIVREASIIGGYVVSGLLDYQEAADLLTAAGVEAGKPISETRRTVIDGLEYGKDTPRGLRVETPWTPNRSPEGHEEAPEPDPIPALLLYRPDVVARLLTRTHGRIVYWRAQFYRYDRGAYRAVTETELSSEVASLVEDRGMWAKIAKTKEEKGEARELPEWPGIQIVERAMVATTNDVREALLHLRKDLVPETQDAPCWLDGLDDVDACQPSPTEILCCRNGLAHPSTDTMIPHTSSYFGFGRLNYDYDPRAKASAWDAFMVDLFGSDTEARDTLHELMGYYLMPDTRQHKIGLIVGPKRGGKGTIARMLRALLGPLNVAGPTLSSLSTDFGLWPIIDRRLAIISDARLGYGTNTSQIVERLLAISGEDAITVDRKYLTPWTGQLPARFLILSNDLPNLGDTSGAIVSRFILLNLTQSWFGREDHTLTDRLLAELPGILVRAMEGYQRLCERGRFVQPQSGLDALQDLEDLSSPMRAFVRDWCERGETDTSMHTLYEVWQTFCAENGRTHPGTVQVFGKNFRSACPEVKIDKPRTGTDVREATAHGITPTATAWRKKHATTEKDDRWGSRKDWES